MNTHITATRDLADKLHFANQPPSDEDLKRHVLPLLTTRALLVLKCLSRHFNLPIKVNPGTTPAILQEANLIIESNMRVPSISLTRFGVYVYDWWLDTQSVTEPEPIDDVLTALNNTTLMTELVRIAIVDVSVHSGVSLGTREKLVKLGFIEVKDCGLGFVSARVTERGKQAIRALRAGVVTALHPGLVKLLKEFNEKDECMVDTCNPFIGIAKQLILVERPMVDLVGRVDGKLKYLLTQQGMIIKTILTI